MIINNDTLSSPSYQYQSWNSASYGNSFYISSSSGSYGLPTNIISGKNVAVGGVTSATTIKNEIDTILNQTARMWVETSIYEKSNNINFKVYITNKDTTFVGTKKIYFYVINQRSNNATYSKYKETIAYYTSIDYSDSTSDVGKTKIVENSIQIDANYNASDAYPWTPWNNNGDKTKVYFVVIVQNATYTNIFDPGDTYGSHWKGYEVGSAAGMEWVNVPVV